MKTFYHTRCKTTSKVAYSKVISSSNTLKLAAAKKAETEVDASYIKASPLLIEGQKRRAELLVISLQCSKPISSITYQKDHTNFEFISNCAKFIQICAKINLFLSYPYLIQRQQQACDQLYICELNFYSCITTKRGKNSVVASLLKFCGKAWHMGHRFLMYVYCKTRKFSLLHKR